MLELPSAKLIAFQSAADSFLMLMRNDLGGPHKKHRMMEILIFIPGSIEPLERGERFDLPLIDLLEPAGGDILDSGTLLSGGTIVSCEITIDVPDEALLPGVFEVLKNGRIPQGSTVSQLSASGT